MGPNDKFIVRIDDVGQMPDQTKRDVGLKYFRNWFDKSQWSGIPLYLGVVPGIMQGDDFDVLRHHVEISGGEICIHGYDHEHGPLTYQQMAMAANLLPGNVRCVIPPYNEYDAGTISSMGELLHGKDPVIFGGITRDHSYGKDPVILGEVLHLHAEDSLYDHSYALTNALSKLPPCEYPRVVTLHHRWDHEDPSRARSVARMLRGRCVTVDEAWAWARGS